MVDQHTALRPRTSQTFRGGQIDAGLALLSLQTAWEKTRKVVFLVAYRAYSRQKVLDRHVRRRIAQDYCECACANWVSVPIYVADAYVQLLKEPA